MKSGKLDTTPTPFGDPIKLSEAERQSGKMIESVDKNHPNLTGLIVQDQYSMQHVQEAINKLEGWRRGLVPALDAALALEEVVRKDPELDEETWAQLTRASTAAMGRLIIASLEATADGNEDSGSCYANISARMHGSAAALLRSHDSFWRAGQ